MISKFKMNGKSPEKNSVLIIAAEASSVLYAQRILEKWKDQGTSIQTFGVGSREMEQLGFERLGASEDMAVVGVVEIFRHYKFLKNIFNNIVKTAEQRRPKVALLLDYPEFNMMLAKKLYALGIPVVYYISPQIWAWRQGRVHKIKKYCRKVLLLFPFEVDFYKSFDVPYEFVGHPILDEMRSDLIDSKATELRRLQCGIKKEEWVLGLMPGSRRSELKMHFAIQLNVARILLQKHSNVRILIMCAPNFSKEDLMPYLENFGLPYMLQKDEPFNMIQLTDFVLVASGTATLMVGLLQKPMVIMYRFKLLSALLAKFLVHSKFFGLANLVLNKEAVPERFQEKANPKELANLLEKYIIDSNYYQQVKNSLGELKHHLGDRGATERVVHSLEEFLN